MANTDYLKFEAASMLDFLKKKISSDGKYTDQIYAGSNLSIILETLSAMFEVFTYNLNFQASESTFNGVQIYENMLKIVNMLGYKARASIAPTIHGTLVGNIYIDKLMPQITATTVDIAELVNNIQSALIIATNPKVISRNLSFSNPAGTASYTILENAQVYPEFINLTPNNIFYWTSQTYTNESEQILNYLRYIWDIDSITLSTTIDELAKLAGVDNKTTLINKLSTLPSGMTSVPCNFRISTNDVDNFVTAVNGGWNSYFVTNSTSGERNESFNIPDINVNNLNISDGTLFAAVYNPSTIDIDGIQIYKSVSSLRNYSSTDKVFEYFIDVNRCVTIRFGDGAYGYKLPKNSSITLFFIVNGGTAGEIAKSAFYSSGAPLNTGRVLQRTIDKDVDSETLIEKFIYDNISLEQIDKSDCNIIAKVLVSNNSNNEYIPKLDINFIPATSSSKFQPIETVEEIREIAPIYNRTNDRIITKNDLSTILKRDFIQYVYDSVIMNNFDYMSKFYNWLYQYDSLTKDVAASGYKFSDSCNFNDVYVWLKGYTNYPINDFIKKSMERTLKSKKILTSELVFLDSITTYFYPYVGSIDDDIDWLVYARDKYRFLINEENMSDPYYKKWKTIDDLFDKEHDQIILRPTKRMINYILSGESTEIKIEVNVSRDANINENMSTIKSNVSSMINGMFSIDSNHLGKSIKLNNLNEKISEISGVRNIKTVKSRNINVYTDTGPVINNILVEAYNESESDNETPVISNVVFDSEISYPNNPSKSSIVFELNVKSLSNISGFIDEYTGEVTKKPVFEIMQLSTGEVGTIEPVLLESDDNVLKYKLYIKSDGKESDSSAIITTLDGGRSSIESAYAIYAKFERTIDVDSNSKKLNLECYSNKIRFAITAIKANGEPSRFKLSTYVDDFSQSTIDLKDTLDTAASTISSEPVWEISDSVYSLSFAKFTNSLIDARDFDTIGASYTTIEDFCFPALYRDISSIITINDEHNSTFGINF